MKKKILLCISCTLVGIIGILIGINYILYKPAKLNSFIASKVYKTPANKAFTDDNFYKCVVDAYNKTNNTSVAYTENLTDEQLETITNLNCRGYSKQDSEKINSVIGIEKLISLNDLRIDDNQLTELDVSNNPNLRWIFASQNQISDFKSNENVLILNLNINNLNTLDISKMPNLFWLEAKNNNLTALNTSNNKYLGYLLISNYSNEEFNKNSIESLDLSNNNILHTIIAHHIGLKKIDLPEIDLLNAYNWYIEGDDEISYEEFVNENFWELELDLYDNNISEIDLSSLSTLKKLKLSGNNLNTIDISNNNFLEELDVRGNKLTEIDVSKNSKLKVLNIGYPKSKLTNIDITNNFELEELNLINNQLTEIDLSKNTKLLNLNLYGNKLNNIDLSNNVALEKLDLKNNNLKKLDISKNVNLKSLGLSGNNFGEIAIVYKGDSFDFSTEYGAVKFPQGFTTSYVSMSSNQSPNALDLINGTTITPNGISKLNFVKYNYIKDEKIIGDYETTLVFWNIKLGSDEYVIKDDYIYTKNKVLNINNIDILTLENYVLPEEEKIDLIKENGKLQVYHEDHLVKEFEIKQISFGNLNSTKDLISITEDMSYEEFTNNITLSEGLSYKIFNEEDEVTAGNISVGMILKVYDGEEVIDEYEITDEYLEFDSLLKLDDNKNFISGISLESSVDSLLSKINTSGKVTIKDNKGNIITGNQLVGTGSKILVELTNETYEYTVIVKGDVTSTGTSTVSDVAKLYQYLKKKIDMEECYKEAGNVVSIDVEIKINDVAKLYQFIKHKINSLE